MLNVFPLNIIHPLVSNFAFQKIADERHLAFGLQYDPQVPILLLYISFLFFSGNQGKQTNKQKKKGERSSGK